MCVQPTKTSGTCRLLDLREKRARNATALIIGVHVHHTQMSIGFQVTKARENTIDFRHPTLPVEVPLRPGLAIDLIGSPRHDLPLGIIPSSNDTDRGSEDLYHRAQIAGNKGADEWRSVIHREKTSMMRKAGISTSSYSTSAFILESRPISDRSKPPLPKYSHPYELRRARSSCDFQAVAVRIEHDALVVPISRVTRTLENGIAIAMQTCCQIIDTFLRAHG